MNRWPVIFFVLTACTLSVQAQRRYVVIDVETKVPIRHVNVRYGAHHTDTTNWQGRVNIPDSCRTLLLSHVNYESRLIRTEEVEDTIYMISKLMGLPEVTVFGKGKGEDHLKELKKHLKQDRTERQLAAIDPSRGTNLLPLIGKIVDKFRKRRPSRRERFRKMIRDY
jgi:hypothetical protein